MTLLVVPAASYLTGSVDFAVSTIVSRGAAERASLTSSSSELGEAPAPKTPPSFSGLTLRRFWIVSSRLCLRSSTVTSVRRRRKSCNTKSTVLVTKVQFGNENTKEFPQQFKFSPGFTLEFLYKQLAFELRLGLRLLISPLIPSSKLLSNFLFLRRI